MQSGPGAEKFLHVLREEESSWRRKGDEIVFGGSELIASQAS